MATTDADAIVLGREGRPRLRGRLHLVGVILVIVVSPVMLAAPTTSGLVVAVACHLLGVAIMLGVSAAYHVIDWSPRWVGIMRRADHSAIFLGIAGSYTPFLVAATHGITQTIMLLVVWVGAAIGIAVSNIFLTAPSWVHTVPYLALGWIAVVLIPALWRLSPPATWLIAAGGLAYSVGAIVYARHRPDPWPATFGFHEVFHALTLVAVALHLWGAWIVVQA